MKTMNDKIYRSSLILFETYPFYHEVLLSTNFEENNDIPTIGVRTVRSGLEMIYNTEFINKLSDENMLFVTIHEIYHFLFSHHKRSISYDHMLSNIAQDMIINTMIKRDEPKNGRVAPLAPGGEIKGYFIPPEYKGAEIFEELYEWLNENKDPNNRPKNGKSDESKGGDKSEEKGEKSKGKGKNSGKYDNDFSDETNEMLDRFNEQEKCGFDVHLADEIPEEMKEQMVKDLIEGAKRRGLISNNQEKILGKLRKSKKDYLKLIKQGLSQILGNEKEGSWSKPNRKNLPFKGYKKYNTLINVILDTSGSMSDEFEKTLSYIFKNEICINLIQCDTEVKEVRKVSSKKEIQNLKIKGLGGTTLQPAVTYIKKNLNSYSTVLLTDGETDTLDFMGVKGKVLILSTSSLCPVVNAGKVKQILIAKE